MRNLARGATLLFSCLMGAMPVTAGEVPEAVRDNFTAGQTTCYGRAYTRDHLARHPDQKITAMLVRLVSGRTVLDHTGQSVTMDDFSADGTFALDIELRLRGQGTRTWSNVFTCHGSGADGGKVPCAIDGDGGTIRLSSAGGDAVLVHNGGFNVNDVSNPVDTPDPEGGGGFFEYASHLVDPGKDDKVFKLYRMRDEVCAAFHPI